MEDTCLTRIMRWKSGGTPGPWLMTLFPTNRCNLRCRHCWMRGVTGLAGMEEMPDERLLRLVDEAAELGVRYWIIIGGGEPLLRGELVMAMAERIRAHGMNGKLQTNATLLKAEYAERLIEMGWDKINVSLDGPDRESNDEIRGGGFEKAVGNLRQLRDLREKKGVQHPLTGLYTVVHRKNHDRIGEMVELANELGCVEGVTLTTLLVHSDLGRPYALLDEQKKEMPAILEKAAALADRYGLSNEFTLYMREDLFDDPNKMDRVETNVYPDGMGHALCYEPFMSAAITADGFVGPCCMSWDDSAQNLKELSLKEAWLGPYLTALRHSLWKTHELPGYCRSCPSVLFCRNEQIREDVHRIEETEKWGQSGLKGRTRILADKAARNLRERGLRQSMRRGIEWARITAKAKARNEDADANSG